MSPEQKPKPSNLATARLILAAVILISFGAALGVAGYLAKNKPALKNTVESPVISPGTPVVMTDQELTLESLENAEYTFSADSGKYQLTDGSYFKVYPGSASGMGEHVGIFDDKIVFGDLNNDDKKDAAVILDSFGGGTGHFYALAVMINKNGEPLQVASEDLGDRSIINSLEIKDRKIIIDMVVGNASCCPTDRKIFEYELQNDILVKTREFNYDEIVQSNIAGWKKYRNNKYGFSIDYPENWGADTNSFLGEPNMVFCSPKLTEVTSEKAICKLKKEVSKPQYENGMIYLFNYDVDPKPNNPSYNYLGVNSFGYYYLYSSMKGNESIIDQILSTFKFIDKASFGNMSAYPKREKDRNYMILNENGNEIIIDQADVWNEKAVNISSSGEFSEPKFSPKSGYLTYRAIKYEWSEVVLYDIKNKKIASNIPSPDTYGFTPDEKYFYACAVNQFSGDIYGEIYNVPNFTLRYDLYKESKDINDIISCNYDEKKGVLTATFSDFETGDEYKTVDYSFYNNEVEVK